VVLATIVAGFGIPIVRYLVQGNLMGAIGAGLGLVATVALIVVVDRLARRYVFGEPEPSAPRVPDRPLRWWWLPVIVVAGVAAGVISELTFLPWFVMAIAIAVLLRYVLRQWLIRSANPM
jgi:hypothetical protein